jgi:molecular chaperone GrpE (heat shock protein)
VREWTGFRQKSVADHYHEAVNMHPSGDNVSKHIEESRRLGKEMDQSLDKIIEHLRRIADAFERANAASSQKT